MNNIDKNEKRAQEIADSLRRYLIGVNTGGIGASLAVASALFDKGIKPQWIFWPALIFVMGLIVSGISMLLAKHRELKRRNALRDNQPLPNFTGFFWRSYTWDTISLILFAGASIMALIKLSGVILVH